MNFFLIECPSLCNSSICWLGFSYTGYPLWVSSLPSSFSHQRFSLPHIIQGYYHLVFLEMKMKSLLSNFIPSLLLLVATDFCNMILPWAFISGYSFQLGMAQTSNFLSFKVAKLHRQSINQ